MHYAQGHGFILCRLDECQWVKGFVFLTVSFAVIILGDMLVQHSTRL
jgi:hypothetical protein